MADWEVVIGLEVHAELLTKSKVFCGCSTEFGADPNSQVCPICMGLPGTLPLLNKRAVELAVKAGLALQCRVNQFSVFARKQYFYPDLVKAYQISQDDLPLCSDGHVELLVDDTVRRIGINRVHLEEEAGKSLHAGEDIMNAAYSLLDYNRAGIGLIEIVTEPDIRSPEEARLFLEKLRLLLQYAEVSDCKMEEGSLRCDANISLRRKGSSAFGVKCEIKNLNSFRAVQRALEFEVERQKALLEAGEAVVPETRHWDESQGMTFSMRSKVEAADYRYFPDPNLYPLEVAPSWVEAIREELPELPDAKRDRFMEQYGLSLYAAEVLTSSRDLADYFEECMEDIQDPKLVSNWVMGEVQRWLKAHGLEAADSPVKPKDLAGLLRLVQENAVSNLVAKDVLEEMFATGKSAHTIVEEKGLRQISDDESLEAMIAEVLEANPGPVEDVKAGKSKAIGFLVGQVMKASKGKANPQRVNELIRQKLQV
ncbi:MAG: Asp-tRNA(Asn)/Glu-tRNA(Gln) amidotransferase subunit GatB [Firmicutes bacterium]|jgi:aspartyl-tRNA(Asn)/glutamyl-tRNA(Gln) amidotransferase subunit B|nr:Asp-tRNA(Asn)/Glu-tRNA(Gln) amidotransferase subunit GatB [Bacillota bacterium]